MVPVFLEHELLDLFSQDFNEEFRSMNIPDIMRTDIAQLENQILIEIELPGYEKNQVKAQLQAGYLVIQAVKIPPLEEDSQKRTYLRRERNIGNCQRKYYVGENVTQDQIHAAMKNGILRILIDNPSNQLEELIKKIEIK